MQKVEYHRSDGQGARKHVPGRYLNQRASEYAESAWSLDGWLVKAISQSKRPDRTMKPVIRGSFVMLNYS